MNPVEKFIGFLSNALFLYGLSEARLGSTALLAASIVATVMVISSKPFLSLVVALVIFFYYLIFSIWRLFLYAALLTSIPSLWTALTNTLALYAMGKASTIAFLEVFVRAEVFSLTMFYLFHCINIAEVSYFIHRISKNISPMVPLLWRSISQTLKEVREILHVHRLKGEKSWKTLSIMFVRGDEMIEMFGEGIYLKRYSFRPKPFYSVKALVLQTIILSVAILLTYI